MRSPVRPCGPGGAGWCPRGPSRPWPPLRRPAEGKPRQGAAHEFRTPHQLVRFPPGGLRWVRGHQAGLAAPPHAAHVPHERDLGDRRRRLHRDRGGATLPAPDAPPDPRGAALPDQPRGRLSHHGPDAQDVQEAGAGAPMSRELIEYFIQTSYIVAAVLFVLALKWLSGPTTARRGGRAGEGGMLLAG